MTQSAALEKTFDILEIDFSIGGNLMAHLAGPDMNGINQISPMLLDQEMPFMDAWGTPIGRAKPRSLSNHVAMVIISVFANSPAAVTMMELVDQGKSVVAKIVAASGASGTNLSHLTVNNVVFAMAPLDFDFGKQAMVFKGIGWNVSYDDQAVASE